MAERQTVALDVEGSTPSTHPNFFIFLQYALLSIACDGRFIRISKKRDDIPAWSLRQVANNLEAKQPYRPPH